MRYVQGIYASFPDAQLILIDGDDRLAQLKALDLGKATFLGSLDLVSGPIDLCVVSTSCQPRLAIYKRCLKLNPRYVILEKYLFNSRKEFEECLALDRVPTFVNQWMYGSKTFDCLFHGQPGSVELIGSGWGLACNAVHWIDVFKRHLQIRHLEVGADTRISEIFPSKRSGYEEIGGQLAFVDRDSKKTFKLIDRRDAGLLNMMNIKVDERVYQFDYSRITEGGKVLSHFPYFSSLIGDIVGEILTTGNCNLPRLEESVSQHLLIEDILEKLDHRPQIT
jgi:hypothetical protein